MERSRQTETLLGALGVAAGAVLGATHADAASIATTGLDVFVGSTGVNSTWANYSIPVGRLSHAIQMYAWQSAGDRSAFAGNAIYSPGDHGAALPERRTGIGVLPLDYQAAGLRDPRGTAERIAGFLSEEFDVTACAAAIEPALRRQRG